MVIIVCLYEMCQKKKKKMINVLNKDLSMEKYNFSIHRFIIIVIS